MSIFLFTASSLPPRSGRTIVFSLADHGNQELVNFIQKLYSEAFKKIGCKFELQVVPWERALLMANAGIVDGDAARVDLHKYYPFQYQNLIKVPVPILDDYVAVFASKLAVQNGSVPVSSIENWADLAPLRVGYIRGHKLVEAKLKNNVPNIRTMSATSIEQGLRMLFSERFDVFVSSYHSVMTILNQNKKIKFDIVKIGILDDACSYPWISVKYGNLVAKLADILTEMKKDGTYDKIFGETLGKKSPVLKSP